MAFSPNRPEHDDVALMARVQAGDTAAFEQLYDRHADRAFWVALAVCHDDGRAEEAVQEGFLAIWRGRANYRAAAGSFRAWAMKIIHNRAIDSHRTAACRPPLQRGEVSDDPRSTPVDPSRTPAEEAIARSDSQALRASLQRLPEAQAEVIVLAFFGDLTHTEIASQLNLPTGTVKGRMRLGLEKLRGQVDVAA